MHRSCAGAICDGGHHRSGCRALLLIIRWAGHPFLITGGDERGRLNCGA
jgi:hypothetical protein